MAARNRIGIRVNGRNSYTLKLRWGDRRSDIGTSNSNLWIPFANPTSISSYPKSITAVLDPNETVGLRAAIDRWNSRNLASTDNFVFSLPSYATFKLNYVYRDGHVYSGNTPGVETVGSTKYYHPLRLQGRFYDGTGDFYARISSEPSTSDPSYTAWTVEQDVHIDTEWTACIDTTSAQTEMYFERAMAAEDAFYEQLYFIYFSVDVHMQYSNTATGKSVATKYAYPALPESVARFYIGQSSAGGVYASEVVGTSTPVSAGGCKSESVDYSVPAATEGDMRLRYSAKRGADEIWVNIEQPAKGLGFPVNELILKASMNGYAHRKHFYIPTPVLWKPGADSVSDIAKTVAHSDYWCSGVNDRAISGVWYSDYLSTWGFHFPIVDSDIKYPREEYDGELQRATNFSFVMASFLSYSAVTGEPVRYRVSYDNSEVTSDEVFTFSNSIPYTRRSFTTFPDKTYTVDYNMGGSYKSVRFDDGPVADIAYKYPGADTEVPLQFYNQWQPNAGGTLLEYDVPYRVRWESSNPDYVTVVTDKVSGVRQWVNATESITLRCASLNATELAGVTVTYYVERGTGKSWDDFETVCKVVFHIVGDYYERIVSPVESVYLNGAVSTRAITLETTPGESTIDDLILENSNAEVATATLDGKVITLTQVDRGRCTVIVHSRMVPSVGAVITVLSGSTEPGGLDDEPDDYTNYPIPTDPEDPLEPEARAQHAYFYDMDWRTSQLKQHCGGFDHGIGRGKTFNAAPGTLYIVYSEHSKREYFRDGVRTEGMEDQLGKYVPTPLLQGDDVWHTDYEAPAFLDTGNIADRNGTSNKRFREVQYVLALDGDTDMQVAFAFLVDGAMRRPMLKPVAEYDPDADVITVSTEYDEPYSVAESVVGNLGEWKLDAHTLENAERVRVRQNVTGKGITASTRIVFKMSGQFKLLGVNYVYREMYSR